MEANSSPYYRFFEVTGVQNVKISGGKLIGDKQVHIYELKIKFVRGGVNSDGSLKDNPNFIHSEILDRYQNPGLLREFRLWAIDGIKATNYSFYQYKDMVSSTTLVGSRNNGGFAPTNPTGRGWFGPIDAVNKMIFVIDISSSPLTDTQIGQIAAKVDTSKFTHEWGQGIEIKGSTQVMIQNVEIMNCTGDAISTSWLEYKQNPNDYTQEQMGLKIYIKDCNLHHCRRQGISLCGSNDIYVENNKIDHIGFADDGITVDGTAPMFGIDIESIWSETNIPTWRPELDQKGFELNTRIHIYRNYIYNNARGHIVNADGINVLIEKNTFEGWNVGGISSYPNNMYIQYINNTFIGCELVVQGDNVVNGANLNIGNIKLFNIKGGIVENCKIKDVMFYGSSTYGYFGSPQSVDVSSGIFTFSSPHGMGNGAKVVFEQWLGKVPSGINPDKLYYTVNVTSTSFQVAETKDGTPVKITDTGTLGFNVSRYDYGRCYISNIIVERDWRDDNSLTPNVNLILTGGVLKNITVKNYEVNIIAPKSYVGSPITVEGLTIIEGGAGLDACNLSNGKFIRVKKGIMGGDVTFSSSAQNIRKIVANSCLFQNVGVNVGNILLNSSTFLNSYIQKPSYLDSLNSTISNCSLENTKLNLHWLATSNSMVIARCTFDNVSMDVNSNTKMIENVSLNL
ncbi:MAG: right-handed parallel beta-helix repeat-containing protein [Bacillota bacterium]|nr:right-handed parallel beta-helix repeat-containing protein [Bacillota bacterium]